MIAAAVDAFGAVDILVNNAVVRHAAPVESFSPERWDEGLAVNLSAAFHTIRLALPGDEAARLGPHHQRLVHLRPARRAEPRRAT